jgi:hypothetical protein
MTKENYNKSFLNFSTFNKKRGRPPKAKLEFDFGTPELRLQRQKKFEALGTVQNEKNLNQILAGSWLHYLKDRNLISRPQFYCCIAFGKLYSLSYRNLGIRKNLSSISKSWGVLKGMDTNDFESFKIQKIWAFFVFQLDPKNHNKLPILKMAIDLISDQTNLDYLIRTTPESLVLYTIEELEKSWEAIEKSSLKTNFLKELD